MAAPNGKINTIMMTLFGIQTTIMVAGVPWAFNMHGHLSALATQVTELKEDVAELPPDWLEKEVAENSARIRDIERRIYGSVPD